MPLARRRRPRSGMALAFGVSALFHTWICWLPLDGLMAASMGAFFVEPFLRIVGV